MSAAFKPYLSVFGQYCPYKWDGDLKTPTQRRFGNTVIGTFSSR